MDHAVTKSTLERRILEVVCANGNHHDASHLEVIGSFERLAERYHRLPLTWHHEHPAGELLSRAEGEDHT